MSECPQCAELRREEEAANAAWDLSRATDCRVLLKRHPDHSERLPEKPKASERKRTPA